MLYLPKRVYKEHYSETFPKIKKSDCVVCSMLVDKICQSCG